jgi:hypothetical protein
MTTGPPMKVVPSHWKAAAAAAVASGWTRDELQISLNALARRGSRLAIENLDGSGRLCRHRGAFEAGRRRRPACTSALTYTPCSGPLPPNSPCRSDRPTATVLHSQSGVIGFKFL